jgi:mono/diheme cytochrome c family protein
MPTIPNFRNTSWHQTRSNAQLMVSILEGKDRLMPANRGPVSDAQAADLVAYIRRFDPSRRARPAAVAAAPRSAQPGSARFDAPLAGSGDFETQFNQLAKEWDAVDRQLRELASAPAPEKSPRKSLDRQSLGTEGGESPAPEVVPRVAQESTRYFANNCARCHTIGGGALSGPDLKHAGRHMDRSRLVRFLRNPKTAIRAHRLGMTRERAEAVLDFIAAESRKDKPRFATLPVPDRPFTAEDVARGRELFAGRRPLASGGPSCVTCHSAYGSGVADGGRLGPELTKVYERVGGRKALSAQVWAAATPTMLPVYQEHPLEPDEVTSLVAYLEKADRDGVEDASPLPLNFLLMGLGGAVVGLAAVNTFWGRHFGPRRLPTPEGQSAAALPPAEAPARLPARGTQPVAAPAGEPDREEFPAEYAVPGL